jgi:hypothetical protein
MLQGSVHRHAKPLDTVAVTHSVEHTVCPSVEGDSRVKDL